MLDRALHQALTRVPPGAWGVGVSGGADSLALLALLRTRADLALHVIHLDHQTRGQASAEDARFVHGLCHQWGLPCTIAVRDALEATMHDLPANASARYRAVRLELFRRAVAVHNLQGVILAHHADDQAETILHRLLRGSSPAGLRGMSADRTVRGVRILRPMLGVRRSQLRTLLQSMDQTWREDASNASDVYLRNRLRKLLHEHPALHDALCELGSACTAWSDWISAHAPTLEVSFDLDQVRDLPEVLAREAGRRWLLARGVPAHALEPAVLSRWMDMVRDAATPARQHFPGQVLLRRRAGRMWAEDGKV